MLFVLSFLFVLACQTQSAFVEYQCVRITDTFENFINGTWVLQLDFEPFTCPEGVKMDPTTTLTGIKSRQMDKLVYNEKDTHIDKRYFKVGTELLTITNHVNKRLTPVAIGLAAGFGFGGFVSILSGVLFDYYKPAIQPNPIYIRPKEDPNANYFEQLRLLEIKDAEAKLKKAVKKAQLMDPTQTAPAKRTGKQGQWCTAVKAQAVPLNNNQPSTSAAAIQGPSGTGPTPPPTPNWTKGTPAPKIGTEKPKKRKNNESFLRNPKVIRITDSPAPIVVQAAISPSLEIEIVDLTDEVNPDLDADVIIIEDRAETFVNNQPGTSMAVLSRVCEDLNPTGIPALDLFRETEVGLITISSSSSSSSSSNAGTIELSSGGHAPINDPRLLTGVQPLSAVIHNAPAVRTHADPGFTQDHMDLAPRRGRQAWMGLGWCSATDSVGNTCTMDSFLSHVVLLDNQDSNYFNQVLRLVSSPTEQTVRNVVRISRTRGLRQQQRSDRIHLTWAQAFPDRFTEERSATGERHINALGSEYNSIIMPMVNSSQIFISHVCACPNEEPLFHSIRNRVLERGTNWNATTIGWFVNSEIQNPNTRSGTTLENINCDNCLTNYQAIRGYVLESTWFHSFAINEDNQDQTAFDLDSYPHTLEFEELVTGNTVHFDIGYISIGTVSRYVNGQMVPAVTHQTSIHYIEGEGWRHYDGMRIVDTLSDVPNNLHLTHRVIAINYFRRVIRRNP